jgi:hypothetical protein
MMRRSVKLTRVQRRKLKGKCHRGETKPLSSWFFVY